MPQQKPRLVLAGPGAGKTHGMVDEIMAALDKLAPHRHLAAITYTNAAANMIRWRRVGVTLLRNAREESFDDHAFGLFVKEEFRREEVSDSRMRPVQDALLQLKGVMAAGFTGTQSERCSSIHCAKGLEADAVLVVATTPLELTKWLPVDRAARAADEQATCRVGYVAFTRAREMLCLACLRPLDDMTRQLVIDRGITILSGSGVRDGLMLYS
jgi:superfamily I DNA/RNA helicase